MWLGLRWRHYLFLVYFLDWLHCDQVTWTTEFLLFDYWVLCGMVCDQLLLSFHENLKRKQIVCFWATREACSVWYSNLLLPPLNLVLGYDKFSHHDYGLVFLFHIFLVDCVFLLEKMHLALNSTLSDMSTPYIAFFWLASAWDTFVGPLMLIFVIMF